MSLEEQLKVYAERAMEELDLAVRAENARAAKAHFALASLHMEKMRGLRPVVGALEFQ